MIIFTHSSIRFANISLSIFASNLMGDIGLQGFFGLIFAITLMLNSQNYIVIILTSSIFLYRKELV